MSDVADSQAPRHDRAWIAVGLFAVFILSISLGDLIGLKIDPAIAAFATAGLLIAARCISMNEARKSIDWSMLVGIAASFGIGAALETSGAAATISKVLVDATRPYGPRATLAAIYFLTMILNELITNNAAAALAFPFCMAAAQALKVEPRPFVMALTLAASYAFASPIGYQTHMMVYGPGGYRFKDFVKVGVPLNLLLWVVAVILVPLAWPFRPGT